MPKSLTLITATIYLIILSLNNYCNAEESKLKIAIVAPFIGNYSSYGKQLLLGAHNAVNDLNSKQNNYNNNIELIPLDDQCNKDLAKSIANKIVKQQFNAVIGHVCSEATLAASPIYAKHGILHLVPLSTNNKITEQNIPTLFRMCGKNNLQAQQLAKFLFNKFSNKKIAILHSQDLYSTELAQQLQEQLVSINIYPTLYQNISLEQFNSAAKLKFIIKKLKKLHIDIIFLGALYPEAANFINTMHSTKNKIPIIASDSIATNGFVAQLKTKKIAAGTIMSFQKLDNITKINDGPALFGYAAVQIINAVLQQNNSKNGRILAHWLHHNTVATILGEKSWDTNGDIINAEFITYLWDENGQYWPLY